MLAIGSIMAVTGFALIWLSPFTGILVMVVGLGIVWSFEDQKIKKKNEQKRYEEEKERQYEKLKFTEPVSANIFELCTLLYGTIKPHETWLLENLNNFEDLYSTDPGLAISESQNVESGKFKSLFETSAKYQAICEFLNRECSSEIFEDIQKYSSLGNIPTTNTESEIETIPTLSEVLEEYDLEEWAKNLISKQLEANNDRNSIIKNVVVAAKKELNKEISVSCLRDEWIINGKIRFKI